jgi:hypothetical protein
MEIIAEFISREERYRIKRIGLVFFDNGVYYMQDRVIRDFDLNSHLQLGFSREEVLAGHIRMADAVMINDKLDLKLFMDAEEEIKVVTLLRKFKVNQVLLD